MVSKDDLRAAVMSLSGASERGSDTYNFQILGKNLIWPYLERVHPKKARVPRYDQFVMRVADADDKAAYLAGEPDVFFTTDHYEGYHTVIVRLDAIDEERLHELLEIAVAAASLPIKQPTRKNPNQ